MGRALGHTGIGTAGADPATDPAERGELPSDGVEVWVVPIAGLAASEVEIAWTFLAPDEVARARRFHFAQHRDAYVASHAALRLLLARYLAADPRALAIVPDAGGRPVLAGSPDGLHFNLSHSGVVGLIAASTLAPVGVDVEAERDMADVLGIARGHFASAEADHLAALAPAERLRGFLRTWTRKEAVVKALGLGLFHPLDAFSTGRTDAPPVLTAPGEDGAAWTVVDLHPAPGYLGALALRHPAVAVRLRQASWPWLLSLAP